MSRLVAIGEEVAVRGFALAGATVAVAAGAAEAGEAWDRLPDDTAVVVLTPSAARALEGRLAERPRLLWAVMPG